MLACEAYKQILLDEEIKISTYNKFLKVMQVVEGFQRAKIDGSEEIEFNNIKNEIMEKLNETDRAFVKKYTFYNGQNFRKCMNEFTLGSIQIISGLSKTKAKEASEKIIGQKICSILSEIIQYDSWDDCNGACAPVSKESKYFDYGIGMLYDGDEIPEGFRVWEVKPTLWAVFKCIGTDGECIGVTWDRIFKEFLPESNYNMLDDIDFELYSENNEEDCFCEIWIPVERK